jgi:hypothetical protein
MSALALWLVVTLLGTGLVGLPVLGWRDRRR